jgi:hypothetical protein
MRNNSSDPLTPSPAAPASPEKTGPRHDESVSRRSFVLRSGRTIIATGLAACTSEGIGPGPVARGTVRVLLIGLHPQATSGGIVTAIGGGQTHTIPLAPVADQSAPVDAGEYTTSYAAPEHHFLPNPSQVPTSVIIEKDVARTFTINLVSTGSITVAVSGLTGAGASSAIAQRTDAAGAAIPISVSAQGSGSATGVPTGVYSVTYSAPAGFTVSGSNPVAGVQVGLGTAGPATFAVIPATSATGSVHVTVTGLTGSATGGSVSARRSDNTGDTFTSPLSTPASGSSSADLTGLPAGTYNVTYTAPTGFRTTGATQNPQQATVTGGGIANAAFAAEPIPVGGAIRFQSDWSTANLGSASNDIRDGGKWNLVGGFGHEVALTTGLNFPTAKACKFVANRSNNGFALLRTTGMPIPPVGTTRYYRWYVRMTFPDALVGNGDHPWQDGNAVSDCNYIVGVHYGSDVGAARNGQWQIGATFIGNTNGAFDNGPWLNKNQTYRVEVALQRLTSTTYDFSMRVYDSSNNLLFDDDDFPADFGGGTLATRGPWTFRNANNLDGFNCGTNDFETAGNDFWTTTFDYGYQGAFAIGDDTGWLGAYGSGTVPGETPPPAIRGDD